MTRSSMSRHSVRPAKKSVSDLALFGSGPAFKDPLHVGRPNIGNRRDFRRRVDDILDRRWLTNGGPYVEEFERRVAEFVVEYLPEALAVLSAKKNLRLMRVAAGRLAELESWEVKCLIGRHLWQDSLHAQAWLDRLVDLSHYG